MLIFDALIYYKRIIMGKIINFVKKENVLMSLEELNGMLRKSIKKKKLMKETTEEQLDKAEDLDDQEVSQILNDCTPIISNWAANILNVFGLYKDYPENKEERSKELLKVMDEVFDRKKYLSEDEYRVIEEIDDVSEKIDKLLYKLLEVDASVNFKLKEEN